MTMIPEWFVAEEKAYRRTHRAYYKSGDCVVVNTRAEIIDRQSDYLLQKTIYLHNVRAGFDTNGRNVRNATEDLQRAYNTLKMFDANMQEEIKSRFISKITIVEMSQDTPHTIFPNTVQSDDSAVIEAQLVQRYVNYVVICERDIDTLQNLPYVNPVMLSDMRAILDLLLDTISNEFSAEISASIMVELEAKC